MSQSDMAVYILHYKVKTHIQFNYKQLHLNAHSSRKLHLCGVHPRCLCCLFVKPAYTRANYPKHTNTAWLDHLRGIWCVPGIQKYKALTKKKAAKESTCYISSTDKVLGFQPFLKIHLMRMDEWSAILTTQKLENNHEVIAFQKVK